jgi:multiple sugar transport system substrate-binding protein
MRSHLRAGAAVLLLALCWLAWGGVGCRGGGGKAEKEVAFWSSLMGSKEMARQALIQDFQKAEGITVNHQGFFDIEEQNKKLLVAMAGGTPPDVASNHVWFLARYAAAGQLEPLDDLMKRAGMSREQFEPSLMKGCVYDGKTYALPVFASSWVLYYNTELFKKAALDPKRPPKTWEELEDYAKRMTAWKGQSIQQAGLDVPYQVEDTMSDTFLTLFYQAGGEFLSPDGKKVAFDGPEGVEALQFLVDLMRKDRVSQIGFGQGLDQTPQSPFNAGTMAMSMMGPWGIINVQKYSPKLPYAVAPLPARKRAASVGDVFVIFIPRAAKHKDAAWRFARFFLDTPNLVKFTKACYQIPAELEAQKDPFFSQDPKMQVFIEATKTMRVNPGIPEQSEIIAAVQEECQQAIYGKKTAGQALRDAATAANAALARGGSG